MSKLLPTVCALTCFCGRHEEVERILRFYIDQTYEGPSLLLLFNNSPKEQQLSDIELPPNKRIILVNNPKDRQTGEEYTNTGDIFRDAVTFIPEDVDIVNHFDSDDIFLHNHLSAGVEGWMKAKKKKQLAYKPYYSYYLYEDKCKLVHNTHEPSIFVDAKYLKEEGFHPLTVSYHQKWLDKLRADGKLFTDPNGPSTFLYNWSGGHGNHKISGSDDNLQNFINHRKWEQDYGDLILTPAPVKEAHYFYRLTKLALQPT